MKKIIVALLVPFAVAVAGCDREESVMEQRASVEQIRPQTTQSPSASTSTAPSDTTASSSTTDSQDKSTIAQGPTTTETPASQSKY